jgi:hypothetical protein
MMTLERFEFRKRLRKRVELVVMIAMAVITAPIWIPMLLCRWAWAIARGADEALAELLP